MKSGKGKRLAYVYSKHQLQQTT